MLSVRACTRVFENGGFVVVCWRTESISLLRESASPFIDEGDGLASERERVRMLLSLVAHAGGYERMVGAHNTV